MKKTILITLVLSMVVMMFAGCGNNSTGSSSTTIAGKLRDQFENLADDGKTPEEIAAALSGNAAVQELSMMTMPVKEGYLNGFEEEITGFKDTSCMFSPMIGSIPFVGYVFESDDPEALAKILEEKSVLNWNICTEADEKVCSVKGNYVFFVMAPFEIE